MESGSRDRTLLGLLNRRACLHSSFACLMLCDTSNVAIGKCPSTSQFSISLAKYQMYCAPYAKEALSNTDRIGHLRNNTVTVRRTQRTSNSTRFLASSISTCTGSKGRCRPCRQAAVLSALQPHRSRFWPVSSCWPGRAWRSSRWLRRKRRR